MKDQKRFFGLSTAGLVILIAAIVKFAMHLYSAPGYGFFFDEFYTIALSRHLAFGYVDLPPLVPALMAVSRAVLGESLLAYRVVPALAGSVTLVFACLITHEFGGKPFSIALSALAFIGAPVWLGVDSVFCYDSIDQMVLSAFLYVLIRLLKTGERKLWLWLGGIAGIACLTKMTILFFGPGFLVALLVSEYRKDLLTPWPWLGALICLIVVSPYLIWQITNDWPTLEYWTSYGTGRVYQASVSQYFINILMYMSPFLLLLWLAGLYRIFRRLDGTNYAFLGLMFFVTLVLMFLMHTPARLLAALFMPLFAAGSVLVEELLDKIRWGNALKGVTVTYLVASGVLSILLSLPILPVDVFPAFAHTFSSPALTIKEFNGSTLSYSPFLDGRQHWDQFVQDVAEVYNDLPEEDRAKAGIYADFYMTAGAIDQLGPEYGLPHAVSGHLTYYLWGPGYSWDVMIIITSGTNEISIFFEECELDPQAMHQYDSPINSLNIFVCRTPVVPVDVIWSSARSYR